MALFINQKDQRSELQDRIAADLANRQNNIGKTDPADLGNAILDESEEATGRSMFWIGVAVMAVIAIIAFIFFVV